MTPDPKAPFSLESLFSVRGRIALVTGGSRGIGLSIAKAYAANGARVYISSRKAEACEAAAAEIAPLGECFALPANLASEEGAKSLASALAAREERLDILVNNAGNIWAAPLEEYDENAWERVLSLNLKGVFHVTREVLPMLRRAATPESPARVINIGSIEGIKAPRFVETYAYAASKAGVHHLTRSLAYNLGPQHITVNAIAPGFIDTKLTRGFLDDFEQQTIERCPLGRLGNETDIAGLALYLASPSASYVHGAIIPLDGGTIL